MRQLVTMENVLEERRDRTERTQRIKDRAHEMLQVRLAARWCELGRPRLHCRASCLAGGTLQQKGFQKDTHVELPATITQDTITCRPLLLAPNPSPISPALST